MRYDYGCLRDVHLLERKPVNQVSFRPLLPQSIAIPTDGKLHISGWIATPFALSIDELNGSYPAHTQQVKYVEDATWISASFTGVLLFDVLNSAQVIIDPNVTDDKLRLFITALGSDGYQSLISWGEIDPDFGNQPILIAYSQSDKPIDDKFGNGQIGILRLVVPGDKRGGRYVKGLVALDIRHTPPSAC